MGTFNTSLPSPDTDNIYRFGDNTEYYYDLILYNANEEFVRLKTQGVKELIINEFIFNSFLVLTLGSFGISSVDKYILSLIHI